MIFTTWNIPLNADMPPVQNVDTETASMTDKTRRFDLRFPVMVPSDTVLLGIGIN